jgi:threonine dehydrogenase-like Zn-dependent dehydrogenase
LLTRLALIEPLAVGWHAVRASPFEPHKSSAVVFGGGPIGLAVVQALRAQGAHKIIVSEVANQRKLFAQQMGATHVLDPTKDDVVARCKEICDNKGPDVAFDCAGVQASLDTAFDAIRPRGTVVNIAIWEKDAILHPTRVLLKEKKYQGIVTYTREDYEQVLDAIIKGKIKPADMITKTIKMDDILEQGFKALIDDKANQVKILVDCHAQVVR